MSTANSVSLGRQGKAIQGWLGGPGSPRSVLRLFLLSSSLSTLYLRDHILVRDAVGALAVTGTGSAALQPARKRKTQKTRAPPSQGAFSSWKPRTTTKSQSNSGWHTNGEAKCLFHMAKGLAENMEFLSGTGEKRILGLFDELCQRWLPYLIAA